MLVVIPIGGVGERFSKNGYLYPKPLINVLGKPMIFWVIESLKIDKHNDTILIIYREELNKYNFQSLIKNKFHDTNIIFRELKSDTRGAAETVLCGLNNLDAETLDNPIMLCDCDTFYRDDVISKYTGGNTIFYFNDTQKNPIFSYITLNENNVVTSIKEKEKISDNANTGLYCFESGTLLKTYCETILNKPKFDNKELYISSIYNMLLQDNITINAIKVDDFHCLGTPFQLQLFASVHADLGEKLRFCFDLDNTLVSYPTVKNDYSTVEPLHDTIKILRFLKSLGHEIIIYTARRMRTHNGNVEKAIADIGNITKETLQKFDIPYDELHFGKPYANFYIDDLMVSPVLNINNQIGFYNTAIDARSHNTVEIQSDKVIKYSEFSSFEGEQYWYKNIPDSISYMFPKCLENTNKLILERIHGISFSYLYVNNSLTIENFDTLLKNIDNLHNSAKPNGSINIYQNYAKKLYQRYHSFDFSHYDNSFKMFNHILEQLSAYETNDLGKRGVIHGDSVFTNMLLKPNNSLIFIDMRGKIGERLTIFGDIFYDYAKIYQSLIGYDFILHGQQFNTQYMNKFITHFESYIINKFGEDSLKNIKIITNSLLFSLIPLHNNDKCHEYYKLIKDDRCEN